MSAPEFIDITSLDMLASWQGRILQLFEATYARPLSASEWEWIYLQNPAGLAGVCLYVDDGELLGHYATVPIWLHDGNAPVYVHRSMTTMVHPKAQGRGMFTTLAERAFARLEQEGVALVYGFPNQNSAGGFRRMGWTLPSADLVSDLTGAQIQDSATLSAALTCETGLRWATGDAAQMAWRLAKPGADMRSENGLILKYHEGRPNLLHVDPDGLRALNRMETYRLLVPAELRGAFPSSVEVFEYQFGYKFFKKRPESDTFKVELIMSDVF